MSGSTEEYNKQLMNRQIEISEWTYNNRMETLFVFQILFISLMIVAILMYLKVAGMVGGAFVGYAIGLLLLIVVIIITNRAMYTNKIRDKRVWNKRQFEDDNKLDSPVKRGDPAYQEYIDSIRARYGTPPPMDVCSVCPNSRGQ
jgi:ABC-type transport system involved in cytochrome bd biosynthesis fused ATPase/permease subunit